MKNGTIHIDCFIFIEKLLVCEFQLEISVLPQMNCEHSYMYTFVVKGV